MERGNHHLANTTVISIAGKNHSRKLIPTDKKYEEKEEICTAAKYLPTKYILMQR